MPKIGSGRLEMFRRVALPAQVPGTLYLHSMPGRFEDWTTFVSQAEQQKLDLVACLTSMNEIQSQSPGYARARLAGKLPCEVWDFPIPDFGAPPPGDRSQFQDFVSALASELASGARVLLHCMAGIGRTGTVAACLLVELGVDAAEARRLVRAAGSGSEVPAQVDLIVWYQAASRERRG